MKIATSYMIKFLLCALLSISLIAPAEAYGRKSGYSKRSTSSHVKRKSAGRYYTGSSYQSDSSDCHTGPRGGRYRIVNGKKRYGC